MQTQIKKSPIPIAEFDASVNTGDGAVSLPPACFTSEEFFEFELHAVWGHEWFCVGRETDIPKPGDYYTITVGNDPLVVLRERSGEVAVISNVCRHRGMLIVEGRGNARRLRCPLHSWVYGLDGKLISGPGVPAETVEEGHVCLPRMRSEVWEGFIFITFDESLPPLAERLEGLGRQFANYKIAELRSSEPLEMKEFDWNWKIFNDECYHCSFLHSSSWGGMYDISLASVDEAAEFNDVENGLVSYNLLSAHIDAAPTRTGKVLQPVMPELTETERQRISYVTVAPNLLLVAMPDKVKYFLWLPLAAMKSAYGVSWLYPPATLEHPDYRENFDKEVVDLWPVMEEDLFAWKGMQTGFRSRFATRGPLMDDEKVIQRLQAWLVEKYRAQDGRAGDAA